MNKTDFILYFAILIFIIPFYAGIFSLILHENTTNERVIGT